MNIDDRLQEISELVSALKIIQGGVCPECGNVIKQESPKGMWYCTNWIECRWQLKPPMEQAA